MGNLIFKQIEKDNIFTSEYIEFKKNNNIEFSNKGIAILYGPNGTGKTSLVKVLSSEKGTKLKYNYKNKDYSDNSQFYIINDQNNRNIIHGTEKDFLIGDNVKKELEMKESLESKYIELCNKSYEIIKSNKIASSNSNLLTCFTNFADAHDIVKDLANSKSKGKKIGKENYIKIMEQHKNDTSIVLDKNKLNFIIDDLLSEDPISDEIEKIVVSKKLSCNKQIQEVEENLDAIKILSKYKNNNQCIICDTKNIEPNKLIKDKEKNKDGIIASLDDYTKNIVNRIISIINDSDPFGIKDIMLAAIKDGKYEEIIKLKKEISNYKINYAKNIICELVKLYLKSDIKKVYDGYSKLISKKPEISDEDLLYIKEIISNNMNKKLLIERDENKNIRITLDNKDFLEMDRNELPLSTGEQNFLSLTLEFVKAKNSNKPIVILDDPISSFDSIYKNKIAFAIVKILENKEKVILTHNIDLLRLLDGQFKKCFNLYLFNNVEGEENGFIRINNRETEMLLNIDKLLNLFREEIFDSIKDEKLFLVSLIPFMRGYANILNNKELYDKLTSAMHGYMTDYVDLAYCYRKLFGDKKNIFVNEYNVDVAYILRLNIDEKEIVDKEKFPLLNRTLFHSFIYLYLRLSIEKVLVKKYCINTKEYRQLGQIIAQAYPNDDSNSIKSRVFLTTKKTLLNDFNHFESNISIFQPAIDISDDVLKKEKDDVINFVKELE